MGLASLVWWPYIGCMLGRGRNSRGAGRLIVFAVKLSHLQKWTRTPLYLSTAP
jgi:hypothetical protein